MAFNAGTQDNEETEARYNYSMLQFYNRSTVEDYLSKFQLVKVPTGNIEKIFFYIKKYPKDFLNKEGISGSGFDKPESAYKTMHKAELGKKGVLDLSSSSKLSGKKPVAQESKSSKIKVKTFSNPLTEAPKVQQGPQTAPSREVSSKLSSSMPDNRTVLVVNFDKLYPDAQVKKIFSVMGQVRRVFSGSLQKKKSQNSGRNIFYHVVIYKHEKDMLRMFDLDLFQRALLDSFLPEFKLRSEAEKELTMREYLKTIQDEYDQEQVELVDSEGFTSAALMPGQVVNPDKPLSLVEQLREETKRRKKKGDRLHKDFYKFQLRELGTKKAIQGKKKNKGSKKTERAGLEDGDGGSDGDSFFEGKSGGWLDAGDEQGESLNIGMGGVQLSGFDDEMLDDADFLKKRKAALKASFQQQVEQVKQKKKLKQA